jgi:transcriptional regulator with XRE-family HTH domain/quercetin dioxygenase-like cupin family protein
MPASDVPWLGQRIRDERIRRGISLRGLARDVGVSASMISQIETAKSRPSVSTLYAITTALGISVEDLFTAATPEAAVPDRQVARAGAGPTTVVEALGAMPAGPLGPLVRPDDRQVLILDSGVTWELLGDLPHRSVEFLKVTYAPGGTSSSSGGLMRHPGSEYGYLLRGELVLTLGFEEIQLHPGDAVSFDSTTPHSYRNDGTEPAVGVWFVITAGGA